MILPTTYLAALLLAIASMICWGSWANMQKLAGKWRFELFYYDYSVGVLICAVIAAFTLGSWLPQELTFSDNLLIASRRQMAYAVGAGAVFNLANMLLVAAIAVSGMAVAFPVAIGLALVIGVIGNFILNPQGNPILLFSGVALVVVAIIVDALAYGAYLDAKQLAAQTALTADPRAKVRRRALGAGRGITLSVLSGILMGLFYPLVEIAKGGDAGVGPYGIAVLFSAGVLMSTVLYAPFFLNFPVSGPPIPASDYLKGTGRQHMLGIAGGIIWMAGGLCNFVAASAPVSVQLGPAASYALGQGATMVSALWGLLVWHEFEGANPRVKALLAAMILLFVVGLALISIAPLWAT